MLLHYAGALRVLGRYDDFEAQLEAAEALDPQLGAIFDLRGDYFFSMERYEEAIAQYEKAIEIDGDRLGPRVREKLQEARERWRKASP